MTARQKIRTPNLAARIGQIRRKDDKRRQILIFGAETVTDPRTEARTLDCDRTGVNAKRRLKMIAMIAVHRANQTNIVHAFADMRETDR